MPPKQVPSMSQDIGIGIRPASELPSSIIALWFPARMRSATQTHAAGKVCRKVALLSPRAYGTAAAPVGIDGWRIGIGQGGPAPAARSGHAPPDHEKSISELTVLKGPVCCQCPTAQGRSAGASGELACRPSTASSDCADPATSPFGDGPGLAVLTRYAVKPITRSAGQRLGAEPPGLAR
jgi:hypothetical protein